MNENFRRDIKRIHQWNREMAEALTRLSEARAVYRKGEAHRPGRVVRIGMQYASARGHSNDVPLSVVFEVACADGSTFSAPWDELAVFDDLLEQAERLAERYRNMMEALHV